MKKAISIISVLAFSLILSMNVMAQDAPQKKECPKAKSGCCKKPCPSKAATTTAKEDAKKVESKEVKEVEKVEKKSEQTERRKK